MSVTIGTIGGSPLMKCLGPGVIGENLPLTKSLDGGGGLSGLMGTVMGGGMGSIVSNPLGGLLSQAQGKIAGAVTQIGGALGASAAPLISALSGSNGLAPALAAFRAAGDNLATPDGILRLVAHHNVAQMAGSALPPQLGLSTVLAPLAAEPHVAAIDAWLDTTVAGILAGTVSVSTTVAQANGHRASLDALTMGSSAALAAVETMAPSIAATSALAACCVAAPPEMRTVLERTVSPETLAVLRASVARHLDPND